MSANVEPQTVRTIIDKTAKFFVAKGIPSARLDAELLLAEVLGMDRLRLYMNFDRPLNEEELNRARELVRRRATREPVAYILGRREFASRMFEVDPSVLIPRPETELLVDEAEQELKRRFPDAGSAFRILEFGVGSGAIAVTLAANLPAAQIVGTEISAEAAATARRNADKHGVSERIDLRVQPDFAGIEGPFHAIVANPPYVDPADALMMADDVKLYEPAGALFAEENGLHWYRLLAVEAPRLLDPNGFLLMEIGQGQMPAIAQIAKGAGLDVERVSKDYAGTERMMRMSPSAIAPG
ncbi:MAG: peptide chain release factor N(5)-glutamine methyltransferase [Candidatus Sumerlaeaceae bacterium]